MPNFSADGSLWFMADVNGFWNLYRWDEEQNKQLIQVQGEIDQMSAPWQSGIKQHQVNDRTLACLRFETSGIKLLLNGCEWTPKGINHIREFALFDLNYRGRSNQGRNYRNKLARRWGEVEVEDIATALENLISSNRAGPNNVFIRGRSSGGYSVLMSLCSSIEVRAATSYFGVSDPISLSRSTHKFESHYLEWLIPKKELQTRSPLARAKDIGAPVLFFQGCLDPVVTPDQTDSIFQSLRSSGLQAEVHYFEDESHGFKQIENQIESLELELDFYRRYLSHG